MEMWDDAVSSLLELANGKDGKPTIPLLVVRYEDLCVQMDEVLPKVLKFIGADYRDAQVR